MKKLLFLMLVLLGATGISEAKTYYLLQLRIWQKETFSFNIKNRRNAIILDIPVDKRFFNKVKKGETIHESSVYKEALDIIPELFTNLVVEVENKTIVNKEKEKSLPEDNKLYSAIIYIRQDEALSFDWKHKRNAIKLPLPLDKDFFY